MTKKAFKKIIALVLSVALASAVLPLVAFSASAQDNRVVDPSTLNSWKELFPADDTTHAGRVWTDKTVLKDTKEFKNLKDALGEDVAIEMLNEDENFLIALSAIASNKSIVGYSYTPTDTMLVLDVSGSMATSNYVSQLVESANDAINKLLALNKHNRVGVVLYSGVQGSAGDSSGSTATVLLPIDRYTHQNNEFVVVSGSSIGVNSNVKKSDGTNANRTSKNVAGGTYIQNGIYMAMQQLLAQDTVIPDGEIQAGTTRTPIMVLMSDGAATSATSDFAGLNRTNNTVGIGTSNLGDGTSPSETLGNVIDFATQLTAAYAKAKISEHYGATDTLFYTLGVGSSNNYLNSAVLNPAGFKNTDAYWEDYVKEANNTNIIVEISSGRNPRTTSFKKLAEINNVEQKNYATKYYPARDVESLKAAFESIVKQIIIQSLYYPTFVEEDNHDHDGFVEFVDDIGHYMEIKDIKGILMGNTLFTGEQLAKNFVSSGGDLVDSKGNWTALGNNVVWSVQKRIGISDVTVARDLINSAYEAKQLYYDEQTGEWSNFIGWYSDDRGNFMGHWNETHTADDIPEINGVKATYINRSYGMLGEIKDEYADTDLMYISTQIHTRISDGNQSLIWRIPASLIPIINYNVKLEGENIETATGATIEYIADEPIRILFEVGLLDKINPANVSEIVGDPQSHIIDENNDGVSDDGKYYFYTNWWNDANVSHEHFSRTNDTIVFFEPSKENERYYYTETTPVLIKDGQNYVKYIGAQPDENDGNTYYRQYYVFKGNDIVLGYEQMSNATIEQAVAAQGSGWNIPAGIVHRFLEPYNELKDENLTNSIKYANYPVAEEIFNEVGSFYVGNYLGNNGRISMDIPQGIKLTKTVDDTLYGTDDNNYTFTIYADGITDTKTAYKLDATGEWSTFEVAFVSGTANVTIKAGETVYVLGLDEVAYEITENINGNYKVSQIKVNGVAQADTSKANTVVQHNTVTAVEFTNTLVVNNGTIVVSKEVDYDTVNANQEFKFKFEFENASPQEFTLKAGESKTFSGLSSGNYIITEIDVPEGYTPVDNSISVTIENGLAEVKAVHFVNGYAPSEIKPLGVVVTGTKTLEGREWKTDDEFTFVLQYLTTHSWETIAERTVEYNAANYKFDFAGDSDLTNFALTERGTYYFRVIEKIPADKEKLGGVEYDTNYKYFNIVVDDADMDGKLEIADVLKTISTTVTEANNVYTVTANFKNVYSATVGDEIVINITKVVDNDKAGTDLSPEGYVFGLFSVGGTEAIATSNPTDAQGKTNISLSFPASSVGHSYTFEVREIVPADALNGMQYDTIPRTIVITIEDNLNGTITAKIDGSADNAEQNYTNVYAPNDVTVTLEGTKVMDGRNFHDNEFTFILADKENYNNDGDNFNSSKEVGHTSKVEGGKIDFGSITFSKIGTYKYTVSEVQGQMGGVTYSDKVYDVEIIVSDDADNNGTLDVVVKIDGNVVMGSTADTIVFENIYEAEEAKVIIEATKNLEGRDINTNDNFKFDLYQANSEFVKGNVIYNDVSLVIDAQNAKKGLITFDEMTFGTEGDWYFVAVEDGENGKGITVDKTEYKIHVNVSDNLAGKLITTVKVDGNVVSGSTKDAIVFNNKYMATASLTIAATKKLDGREIKPDEFIFELYNDQNQKIGEAKVKDGGKVEFEPIVFAQTGDKTYNYTVKEVAGSDSAISYDTKIYAIKVETVDNGDGTLTIKTYVDTKLVAGSTKDEIVFNNTYSTSGSFVIQAEKELVGRDLVAGEFEFELYDELGAKVETVKNDADGKIVFSAITVNKAGKKVYTIKEVKGDAQYVTYDDAVYTVEITATDNGDGTLTIAQKYFDANDDEITKVLFENTYKEPIKPPQTGDTVNTLLIALVVISTLGLVFVVKSKKQNV